LVLAFFVLIMPTADASAEGGPLYRLAPAPRKISAVAYAGSERLYVTGHALMRRSPGGRTVRVARLWGSTIQLEASRSVVALIEQRGSARRLLVGPPRGPLHVIARCRGSSPDIPYSLLAVAGGMVAEALSCERARGVYNGARTLRVRDGDLVRVVQEPPGTRAIRLAGAPGALAIATQAASLEGPLHVDVVDPRTFALRYALDDLPAPMFAGTLAVQPDGLTVVCGAGDRLAWASPAAPSTHAIGRVRCATHVELAQGRVAYHDDRSNGLRVTDLAGHARSLIRRSGDVPFDWSGRRLLVRGLDCGEDFLGELKATGSPYRGRSCRVRIARVARTGDRRSVQVTLTCSHGCRGVVELQLGSAGIDTASLLRRHAGRRVVRIELNARARQQLLLYRTVPFSVDVAYTDPASGADAMPVRARSGTLPGDGRRRFPPPPPPPTGD
jgi:hypothetical protein